MSPRARPLLTLERTLGDLAWRLPSRAARLEAAADDRHVWVLYEQSGKGAVALWDVERGCEVAGTSFATRRVFTAAASRDGRTLALAHDDAVTVWDAYAGATIRTLEGALEPWLALDEHGARLLVWGGRYNPNERGASLYDVSSGARRRMNVPTLAPATLSLDAATLVTSDRPCRVQSWDLMNGAPRELHAVQTRGRASEYASVSDGDVFVGTSEGEVRRWSPRNGITRWLRDDLRHPVVRLCATPDGRRVALTCTVGVSGGVTLVLDGHTGETLLSRPCASPHALALAPGGRWLATVERGVLSVMEAPGGARRERASGHEGPVTSVAFSPDGSVLASAASDGVRVWDLATGDTRLMLETALEVESLAFMPDGRALVALTSTASTLEPAEVVAWDLAAGHERSRAPTPETRTPLTVSPDARYALWATTNDASDAARCTPTLHVWDLARPRPLLVIGIPGHDGAARYVTVTPDGREVTVFSDYRWWRVELGTLRRVAQGQVTYRGRVLDLGVGIWRLGWLLAVRWGLLEPPEPEPGTPVFERSVRLIPSSRGRQGVVAESVDARRQVFVLTDVGPYEPHGLVDLGAPDNAPTCMDFSPDAKYVAVGTDRGVLRVFRAARA